MASRWVGGEAVANKGKAGQTSPAYKIDTVPYAAMAKQAGELADRALLRYGEPRMSLLDLRRHVDEQLQGTSLSECIVGEREAEW